MEKKELIKKEDISRELEMNLDEMDALFSEETLDIMRMGKIVGGAGIGIDYVCNVKGYCPNNSCGNTVCGNTGCGNTSCTMNVGGCPVTKKTVCLDCPNTACSTNPGLCY